MATNESSSDDDDNLTNPMLNDNVICSPSKQPPNKLTGAEHREFQRVVAVFAYDANPDSMTQTKQQEFLYDVVHGTSTSSDKVSQLELLVQGINPRYAKLYTKVQPEQSSSSNDTTPQRMIHHLYSPNNNTRFLYAGDNQHINVGNLQRATLHSNVLVTGRALLAAAREAVRNGKKAMAFAKSFLHDGTSLPSGKTIEDLLNHIKDEMWANEQARLQNNTNQEPAVKKRPSKSVFNGYVAFVLFACPILVDDTDRLQVYCRGGEKEGKSASRAVQRKKLSDERSKKRSIEGALYSDRGLTIDQQIKARVLSNEQVSSLQKEIRDDSRIAYQSINEIEKRIQSIISQRSQAMDLLKLYKDIGIEDDYKRTLLEIKSLTNELQLRNNEMNAARAKNQSKLNKIAEKRTQLENMRNHNQFSTTPNDTNLLGFPNSSNKNNPPPQQGLLNSSPLQNSPIQPSVLLLNSSDPATSANSSVTSADKSNSPPPTSEEPPTS